MYLHFFRLLHRLYLFVPLIALLWLVPTGSAVAAEVKLGWDLNPESDLAGYKIHYGTKSRSYSRTIDVGKRTSYDLTNLEPGTTYYFAATAYNTKGTESTYSNEVSTSTPAANPSLGVTNLTPGDYQIAPLRNGDFFYTDRTFRVSAMPAGLEGVTAIKTANNDKFNKQEAFLSFTINQDMDIYVAYDARAIRLPSWLTADFTDTGNIIETTDVTFTLWQRTFPAGSITLPGNYYGNPSGGESNYFALLATAGNGLPGANPSVAVSDLQPGDYQSVPLREGDTYFTDRNFIITALPADLEGTTAIRTANNDKYNSQDQLLSFSIKESATVYVAYDSRATRMPAWLTADFTDTGLTIQTTDVAMNLWQKTFPAGTVSLPGNYYGSPEGPNSNYFVVLAPTAVPAVVQPSAYQVDSLEVGEAQFIDRDYEVTAMPSGFAGMKAIKTANDDKYNSQAEHLSFKVNRNATVYVAYDTRATRLPSWLTADFTQTGQTIQTTDVPMALWRRAVSAGTVTLPGNFYGNPAGVGSNYFVLVD